MYKISVGHKICRVLLCIVFCLFALIPIYTALIVSLTPYSNMLEAQLFPHYFEIRNYADAFLLIWRRIFNSFLYASAATVVTTAISIPAAYVLARYRFRLRTAIMFLLLLTQMMAGIVVLPTVYRLFNRLKMLNNPLSLILVYTAMNLALVITILEGYFSTLPEELDEAAFIDGCSYLQLILRILLPVSGPGIAVGAIFVFVNTYNEFVVPLFLLSDSRLYTLTLTVYSLVTDTTIRWHVMAAASIIGIIPPVIIFTVFQNYILAGIVSGAVKG